MRRGLIHYSFLVSQTLFQRYPYNSATGYSLARWRPLLCINIAILKQKDFKGRLHGEVSELGFRNRNDTVS